MRARTTGKVDDNSKDNYSKDDGNDGKDDNNDGGNNDRGGIGSGGGEIGGEWGGKVSGHGVVGGCVFHRWLLGAYIP